MSKDIVVPSVGESITEVTISDPLKKVGDIVRIDEPICTLETDKATVDVPSTVSGKITKMNVKVGSLVPVGSVICTIDELATLEALTTSTPLKAPITLASKGDDGVRKPADQFLIDTLPSAPKQVPIQMPFIEEGTTRKKMTKLRRVIAQKLVEVKNQTAMLTTFNEVDMSEIIAVREKEQESFTKKHGVKLGFMSFFVKAVAKALQEFPDLNARIEGDEIVNCNYCHIGVAVGTEKGLLVPVLKNADQMSYVNVEKTLKNYAEKARAGTLSVDNMQGGTFTLTNGGVYGSLLSTPILNPPQSGILGMHAIMKRAMVVDDQIVIRPMMYLALSYDHRIVDGKESIGFLVHIKKNLEDPARFLLDL
jgi:2-oxoglutarate dehydrogenase E2 component (dihydrolipoamide succinyltransferase)